MLLSHYTHTSIEVFTIIIFEFFCVPNVLHALFLILITVGQGRYYSFHFADEELEAQRG